MVSRVRIRSSMVYRLGREKGCRHMVHWFRVSISMVMYHHVVMDGNTVCMYVCMYVT